MCVFAAAAVVGRTMHLVNAQHHGQQGPGGVAHKEVRVPSQKLHLQCGWGRGRRPQGCESRVGGSGGCCFTHAPVRSSGGRGRRVGVAWPTRRHQGPEPRTGPLREGVRVREPRRGWDDGSEEDGQREGERAGSETSISSEHACRGADGQSARWGGRGGGRGVADMLSWEWTARTQLAA